MLNNVITLLHRLIENYNMSTTITIDQQQQVLSPYKRQRRDNIYDSSQPKLDSLLNIVQQQSSSQTTDDIDNIIPTITNTIQATRSSPRKRNIINNNHVISGSSNTIADDLIRLTQRSNSDVSYLKSLHSSKIVTETHNINSPDITHSQPTIPTRSKTDFKLLTKKQQQDNINNIIDDIIDKLCTVFSTNKLKQNVLNQYKYICDNISNYDYNESINTDNIHMYVLAIYKYVYDKQYITCLTSDIIIEYCKDIFDNFNESNNFMHHNIKHYCDMVFEIMKNRDDKYTKSNNNSSASSNSSSNTDTSSNELKNVSTSSSSTNHVATSIAGGNVSTTLHHAAATTSVTSSKNALNESLTNYMNELNLNETIRYLSFYIADQSLQQNCCFKRSNASVSAGCIYLACALEEMHITQHQFCHVVALTEVTLRKVYRELSCNWPKLVPPGYMPKTIIQHSIDILDKSGSMNNSSNSNQHNMSINKPVLVRHDIINYPIYYPESEAWYDHNIQQFIPHVYYTDKSVYDKLGLTIDDIKNLTVPSTVYRVIEK